MSSANKSILSPRGKSSNAAGSNAMSPREPSKSFGLRGSGLLGRGMSRMKSNAQREENEIDEDAQGQASGDLSRSLSKSGRFGSSRNLAKTSSTRNLFKTAVRNTGRLGQHPSQFELKIYVEKIDKLPIGTARGDYVICMSRGDKTYSTKPFRVSKKGDTSAAIEDTITAIVTLFQQNVDDTNFCEKLFKFSMRPHQSGKGRVKDRSVDKVNLDVAQYVEVPSGSRRLGANMVNGGQLVLRLESTFLGAGSASRSSAGSKVAPSEFDCESSLGGSDGSLGDLDGLSDPEGEGQSQGSLGRNDSKLGRNDSKLGRSNSRTGSMRLGKLTSILRRGGDNTELEKLKAQQKELENENQVLEKENDALICALAARTDPSGRSGGDSNTSGIGSLLRRNTNSRNAGGDDLKTLIRENQALKLEVKELRKVLEAEKEADEIVDELKDAKLELAMAYLEKEQLHLELMTLIKKVKPNA